MEGYLGRTAGWYRSRLRNASPTPSVRTLTVLGVETSCDETASAVVRWPQGGDGPAEVLSSVVASQVAAHAPYGGVVPEVAARAHVEIIDDIIAEAMREAGLGFAQLDGVAATAGPGLVGGVMVGLSAGKAIALARGLPLIAVNHLEGHAVSRPAGGEGALSVPAAAGVGGPLPAAGGGRDRADTSPGYDAGRRRGRGV